MSRLSYLLDRHSVHTPSKKSIQEGREVSKSPKNEYIKPLKKASRSYAEVISIYTSSDNSYRVLSSFPKSDARSWIKQICYSPSAAQKTRVPASIQVAFPTLDQQTFDKLASSWKEEIGGLSSLSKITSNSNYLKVIGYGKSAVPFILRDLQVEPAPWFTALRIITGKQNVGREHLGNFKMIAAAWLQWGREAGLI